MGLPPITVHVCDNKGEITSYTVHEVLESHVLVEVDDVLVPKVVGIDVFKTKAAAFNNSVQAARRARAKQRTVLAAHDEQVEKLEALQRERHGGL